MRLVKKGTKTQKIIIIFFTNFHTGSTTNKIWIDVVEVTHKHKKERNYFRRSAYVRKGICNHKNTNKGVFLCIENFLSFLSKTYLRSSVQFSSAQFVIDVKARYLTH